MLRFDSSISPRITGDVVMDDDGDIYVELYPFDVLLLRNLILSFENNIQP